LVGNVKAGLMPHEFGVLSLRRLGCHTPHRSHWHLIFEHCHLASQFIGKPHWCDTSGGRPPNEKAAQWRPGRPAASGREAVPTVAPETNLS
jgi:hypothetical protein